ncbi:MAG: DUF2807 domain-containing protein [Bacteroidetes bacterium]|nr:DUF2807 domain-containing protein [Bacteroidota bacterium]
MKTKILLPFLFLIVLSFGCNRTYTGQGPVVDEVREVGEFNRIVLNMEALVVVKDSLVHSCVVKAQGNIQEAIITRMDGNTLVITTKGQLITNEEIVIEISMNKEMAFEVNGSGKILSMNTFKNDELDFEINGSGVIEADVVANKITSNISGSGILDLSGSANSFNMQISGSGTVNSFNLVTLDAKASISGSGEADECRQITLCKSFRKRSSVHLEILKFQRIFPEAVR